MCKMNLTGGSWRSSTIFTSFKEFYLFAPFVKILPSTGSQVITQFKEQGLNTELYYKNKDMGETFNIVPTSAIR